MPGLAKIPAGCPFSNRCPKVQEQCRAVRPVLEKKASGNMVACHLIS